MMESKKTTITEPNKEDFFNLFITKIETEDNFWNVLIDAKNNLTALENLVKSNSVTEIDFMESFNEIKPNLIPFDEYLTKSEITLPDVFRENTAVKELIAVYDSIIDKLKQVTSKADFVKILPEMEKIPQKGYKLGIYHEE